MRERERGVGVRRGKNNERGSEGGVSVREGGKGVKGEEVD